MDAMSNRTMDKGHVVINEDNVRRSDRLKTTELNGRGYLSDQMGCTVFKFEEWMKSSSVLPHLLQWDKLCIKGVSRYNDVVDKINSGEFYDVEEFEDDLILACLSENHEHSARFTAPHIITCDWTTVDVWARTAWRIVWNNKAEGQIFHHSIHSHPTKCYAFAIDMLCIIFHSIAHRGAYSCYHGIMHGNTAHTPSSFEVCIHASLHSHLVLTIGSSSPMATRK